MKQASAKETRKVLDEQAYWRKACEILNVNLYAWTDKRIATVITRDTGKEMELSGLIANKLIEMDNKLKGLVS